MNLSEDIEATNMAHPFSGVSDMEKREDAATKNAAETDMRALIEKQPQATNDNKDNTAAIATEQPSRLPKPVQDLLHRGKDLVARMRRASILAAPEVIVNNSPNVIGAMQLTAELAMFKSNGSQFLSPESKGNPLRYVIDPPMNVYRSVAGRAKANISLKDFAKPEFYRDTIKNFTNLKSATEYDLQRGPLVNRWQARATFAGIVGWGLNFITPNAKETPEQIEANVKLSMEHPGLYVLECFRRAVVFPLLTVKQAVQKIIPGEHQPTEANDQIGAYKRQFSGLGMMIAGMCSFLGGWRNVSRTAAGVERYYLNWQYCATGAITFLSSLPLLFSVDNNKGYSHFGLIHLGRCFFLPGSILKKWNSGDKGTGWYITGHSMLQSKNAFAAMVGGAKKHVLPDGTVEILDNTEVINEAKQKEQEIKQQKRQHRKGIAFATNDNETIQPLTKVLAGGGAERAMPERVEQVKGHAEAANDGSIIVASNAR